MKKNESSTDRVLRAILGVLLLVVAYYFVSGTLSIILYILGAVALFTALTGFCALYTLLGITTRKK